MPYPAFSDGPSSVTIHPYTHNTSREQKNHYVFPIMLFPYIRPDTHKLFQPNPITIDSVIVPHQTAAQKRYLLYIIASVSLDASKGITKSTATKQSGHGDVEL